MVSLPGNAAATSFINFVNAAPTPFHAVKLASLRLENAGFKKVYEHDADWEVKPGKYFLTRWDVYRVIWCTKSEPPETETRALCSRLRSRETSNLAMEYPSLRRIPIAQISEYVFGR
jgi:aspartyl aminopeptidase